MSNLKSKILIIGPLPPPFAGPEIVTKNLIDSIELNESFEVHILNTTVRKNNSEKGKVGVRMFIAYFLYIFRLLKSLIVIKPNLVFYLPTSATIVGWVRDGTTIFLSFLFRRKTVILMQGGHFRFFYENSNYVVRCILKWLLNRCNKIFVQADRLKFQFKGIVPEDRLKVFYNFMGEKFISEFGDHKRSSKTTPKLLFVGHLTTAKGYCDLLKVLPDLTNINYLIIGSKGNSRNVKFNQSSSKPLLYEDPDNIFASYVSKNGLESKVKFLGGTVKGVDKINAFKSADIFVLPSYSEGFSTAILEAMSAGLPVIATNVGAAPEIIENGVNGYIVEPGDIGGLRMSIQKLIDNYELRVKMGAINFQLSKEKYNTDVIIHGLVNDLGSLCKQ